MKNEICDIYCTLFSTSINFPFGVKAIFTLSLFRRENMHGESCQVVACHRKSRTQSKTTEGKIMGPLRTDLSCTAAAAGSPAFRICILNVYVKTLFTLLFVHFRNECLITNNITDGTSCGLSTSISAAREDNPADMEDSCKSENDRVTWKVECHESVWIRLIVLKHSEADRDNIDMDITKQRLWGCRLD